MAVRKLVDEFSPRGVYYLEISCGENERAALDYLEHYRSRHMLGIDADYSLRRTFGIHGWPTWVVIDRAGTVRLHGASGRVSAVRQCLEQLLARGPTAPPAALKDGTAFPPEVVAWRQAVREVFPRLAIDPAGKPHVVYCSNRDGTSAVYLRRFNPQGEPMDDERLSPANAEAYGADCTFDSNGTLWVVWCGGHNRVYDIFVQSRQGRQGSVARRLTASDDDAMGPKIAAGPDGTVTVTYYRWAKLNGTSRDRNIFARTWDPAREALTREVEVSPPQPAGEDHTDPDVAIDRLGGAWVVWSCDYHPGQHQKPVNASQPTIFAARAATNSVSPALLVGKVGHAIDLFPSATFDYQGTLWCAWDCSSLSRCIRLARFGPEPGAFTLVNTFDSQGWACSTPELSSARGNLLLLSWWQRANAGPSQCKVALLKDGRPLTVITLAEDVDVLFPQAQQAPDGRYWVTYEKSGPKGSQVVLRQITGGLAAQTSAR